MFLLLAPAGVTTPVVTEKSPSTLTSIYMEMLKTEVPSVLKESRKEIFLKDCSKLRSVT